jgi:hypothetical protein
LLFTAFEEEVLLPFRTILRCLPHRRGITEGAAKTNRGERINTPRSISSVSATFRHTSDKAFVAVTRFNGS